MSKESVFAMLKLTGATMPPTAIVVFFLYTGFNELSAKVDNIEIGAYGRETQIKLNSQRISTTEEMLRHHKQMLEFHAGRINEIQRQIDKLR